MGNTKNVILGLLAATTLFTGCAMEDDYYEGEVVPTRPAKKPSLDPTQPAELTGSGEQSDIPGIDQSKLPTNPPIVDHTDGRIQWAEEVQVKGEDLTYVHNPNYGTGIDHVEVIDESGETVREFDVLLRPEQIQTNVIPR